MSCSSIECSSHYEMKNTVKNRTRELFSSLRKMLSAARYTPHQRALGAALGVSVGLLPVSPLQLVVLAGVCPFVRCYRALAFVTVWIANPFPYVFIYVGEYALGAWLLRSSPSVSIDFSHLTLGTLKNLVVHHGPRVVLSLLVGGVIISIASGVLKYCITRLFAPTEKSAQPTGETAGSS